MRPQNIRVMLASEYPEVRSFVREMIEGEKKVVVVGQAENGIKALSLAKKLRPDVAIVDSYLPHSIGLDAIPLSRIAGFDTAQSLSSEIPNVHVVLLNTSLDLLGGRSWGADSSLYFCREAKETCIPFTISDLGGDAAQPFPLVFARIEARRKDMPGSRVVGRIFDRVFFFGVLSVVGGFVLVFSMVFAPVGVFVVLGAGVVAVAGLAGKLISRMFRRKGRRSGPAN